ncbi:hypothetical protein KTS45_12445 [Halomicroarcula limicola]|uniref:Uncharacterized protein n=1 Tax=Haloarcula limicola TaxID=1429915 RepID=A0A8J7YAE9_9EURY|nr:hypothetical protein [Halomicroarcula limicola]MBV0925006.1 hypothetical protein [Halomicroarcula limicola]
MTTDVTLETPCLADTCWQRTAVDSGRVENFDLCQQCFPNGWDDVTEEIETFLYSYRNGSKLHRSVDYDGETDFSMFGPNSGDNGLAAKLEDPEFEPDYEFEWDRQQDSEEVA